MIAFWKSLYNADDRLTVSPVMSVGGDVQANHSSLDVRRARFDAAAKLSSKAARANKA